MKNSPTNIYWERLLHIMAYARMQNPFFTHIEFAKQVNIDNPMTLIQIRAGERPIDFLLALSIYLRYPVFNLSWILGANERRERIPFSGAIYGKWYYDRTEVYDNKKSHWQKEVQFEPGEFAQYYHRNGCYELYECEKIVSTSSYHFFPRNGLLTSSEGTGLVTFLSPARMDLLDWSAMDNSGLAKYIFVRGTNRRGRHGNC